MKQRILLSALLLLAVCTACGGMGGPSQSTENAGFSLGSMPAVTVPDLEIPAVPDAGSGETQAASLPAGAIADESGGFVYDGKLQQVGDDDNGYIQVPLGFVKFQDVDVDGLCQYADATGKNIVTLDHYEKVDAFTAAQNMRAYLEQQDNIEGLSGASVSPNGYNAYQVYCHYQDGYFLVAWLIKDPDDTESCYYMSMEFDNDHSYLVACSSTFQTVRDYHAAESAG